MLIDWLRSCRSTVRCRQTLQSTRTKPRMTLFSSIGGNANVLIFPNLSSGNIAYKLLRELGGATAVGPIIVGLDRVVNAIAVGSTVADIVNMAAITVNQVLERET